MSHRRRPEENLIKRFCDLLGRQHFLSGFLDRVAGWLLPAAALPGRARRGQTRFLPNVWRLFMAKGPGTELPAEQPDPKDPWDPSKAVEPEDFRMPPRPEKGPRTQRPRDRQLTVWDWARGGGKQPVRLSAVCAQPQYRGMFGKPCVLHGGSDTNCPKDTTSGWFWKYQTPVGVIYYVDCCGKEPTPDIVVCNWTREESWCYAGRASRLKYFPAYVCTLAIPDAQMRTEEDNGLRVVAGVEWQPPPEPEPEYGTGRGSRDTDHPPPRE